MAITFKANEDRPIKEPHSKLKKARTILLVFTIIATALLVLYLFARLVPVLLFLPLLIFWLFAVLLPTVVTLGIVWASTGYQNFVNSLNNVIGQAFTSLDQAMIAVQKSLPYAGSIALAIIVAYGVISFIAFKKDSKNKSNKKFFIVAIILLVIAITFFIIDIIYYQSIK